MKAHAIVTLGLLSLLVLPSTVFAANDVTVNSSADITANGLTVDVDGLHAVDSVTVDTGSFDVVLSNGSSFKISSTNRYTLSESPTSHTSEKTCTDSESTLLLEGPSSGTATVTITPKSDTCTSGGGGGVISGSSAPSGGGGGGGATVIIEPTAPAPVLGVAVGLSVQQAQSILDLLESFDADQSVLDAVRDVFTGKATTGTGVSASAVGISPVFTRGLGRWMSGSDVKRLQQLLNSDSDTLVASSGVGSSGNETNFFGSLTEQAVQKFQLKHGVVADFSDPGYGYVGPETRAKLQEVFGQ